MNLRRQLKDPIWYAVFVVLVILVLLGLTACIRIPVTVHPPHAQDGQPLALPTAPTGRIENADGTVDRINPAFPEPRPGDHPKPAPMISGDMIEILIYTVLSALGAGGLANGIASARRAKRAEQNEDEVYNDLKKAKETNHVE